MGEDTCSFYKQESINIQSNYGTTANQREYDRDPDRKMSGK